MIAYKVCRIFRDKRFSCMAQGKYELEYKKDIEVKSIKGSLGIFVFRTINDARHFRNNLQDLVILKSECFGEMGSPYNVSRSSHWIEIDYFYKLTLQGSIYSGTCCPEGTLCFKSIIPLE